MVNSKKRIIVMLSFLALLFIFVIGISYAYYAANVIGNLSDDPSLKLTSGYLSMVYEGGDTSITGGSTEGTTNDLVYTKNFTITNDGVADSNFGIWIKNYKVKDKNGIDTTLTRPEDWTYILKSGNTVIKSGTFVTEDEAIISVYPLNMGETIPLTLTLTYNYITAEEGGTDQTADMGKVLSFDIVVVQSIDNLKNTSEGTLLYAINNQYQSNIIRNASDLITIPGQAANSSTEATIITTEDDYGTSYVYRGNIKNNYVNFSEMCWRIVRIEGDGSIKLILEDRFAECNNASFTGNWSGGEDNYYVFGYDDDFRPDFLNYTETNGFQYSLKTFQTSELSSTDLQKLKVDEWCYDDSIAYSESYDDESDGTLNEYTKEYYGAYTRISINKKPSLNCNGTKLTNFKDGKDMYVGALTADEISFAGAHHIDENYNNYLLNDYVMDNSDSEQWFNWWTLSPNYFDDNEIGYAFSFQIVGSINRDNVDGTLVSRPAIVLRSDATLSTETDYIQDGTIDKPYVIE